MTAISYYFLLSNPKNIYNTFTVQIDGIDTISVKVSKNECMFHN
jgi:hypothetical protein